MEDPIAMAEEAAPVYIDIAWCFALVLGLFLFTGCEGATAAVVVPTVSPQVIQGKAVFSESCARCHSTTAGAVVVGPSLYGVADRAGSTVEGLDARSYLLQSILAPDRHLVPGFQNLMPADLAKKLSGEEIDAVIAYLETLHE